MDDAPSLPPTDDLPTDPLPADPLPTDTFERDALDLLASGADVLGARAAGPCPEPNLLAALAEGDLEASYRDATEAHLSLCAACRGIVAALADLGPPQVGDAAQVLVTLGKPQAPAGPEGAYPRPFGRYTLEGRLGGGGMGDVFEAVHADRGRPEALKQLRGGLADDPRALARFRNEVRALASVVHDHVVPLYDAGIEDGVPYCTMPLLPGPSLARLLDEVRETGERPPGTAALAVLNHRGIPGAQGTGRPEATYARRIAGLLAGVADALGALHQAGLVHRDVKPSNVLLDARRRAVLTDFGLVHGEGASLTRAGETLGTPAYMAPEQLEPGGTVDGRSDVYALGGTLYEAVTLQRPFGGATMAEAVSKILRGSPPRARSVNPHLPSDLDAVIGRCLERRPADRYADARGLARDLAAVAAGRPVSVKPVSPALRAARGVARHWKSVSVAAALLLAIGAAVMLRPAHLTVQTVPAAALTLDGAPAGTSPLVRRSLAAGEHRVEARHPKFHPLTRRVSLTRGSTYVLDAPLRPLDPADPETLALLAAAEGLERHEVHVPSLRDPGDARPLVLLAPRGAYDAAPQIIALWADEPQRNVTVSLAREGAPADDAAVHTWQGVTAFRRTVLPIPDEVRRLLVLGSSWRLDLRSDGAPADAPATFRMLTEAKSLEVRHTAGRLLRRREEEGDPAGQLLVAEYLVSRGMFTEAVDSAVGLREHLGDRREIARLALAALEGAGLRGAGPWREWAAVYLRAER